MLRLSRPGAVQGPCSCLAGGQGDKGVGSGRTGPHGQCRDMALVDVCRAGAGAPAPCAEESPARVHAARVRRRSRAAVWLRGGSSEPPVMIGDALWQGLL